MSPSVPPPTRQWEAESVDITSKKCCSALRTWNGPKSTLTPITSATLDIIKAHDMRPAENVRPDV